jgi:hypothetical protein
VSDTTAWIIFGILAGVGYLFWIWIAVDWWLSRRAKRRAKHRQTGLTQGH